MPVPCTPTSEMQGRQLTVIAAGALTNLADAEAAEPCVLQLAQEVPADI